MELKMLNSVIALANVFNPKRQGRLPALQEPLLKMPAHKLSAMIKDGQLSSQHLCQLVSERIKQVQPHINCMCQDRFHEAQEEARRIDQLLADFRAGTRQECHLSAEERELLSSPLLGVPVSVKESIQVRGLRNSCGLWSRRDQFAKEDAQVVKNVRRLGMIPLCTTNVPECTLYWADCQNQIYGGTRNPYDLSRITGASSGGEGGLIASGASLLGIGSDIGGSLRIPAHYCGIYSHKPSPFLLSTCGNFPPIKEARLRLFTLGPMCRYASDLRPFLKCLMQDRDNAKQDTYHKHQPKDIGEQRKKLLQRLDEQVELSKLKFFYFNFNESSQLKGKQSVRVQEELMKGQREVLEHFANKFQCQLEELNLDKYLKRTLITWQCLMRCASKQDREEAFQEDEMKQQFGINSLLMEFIKMPLGLSRHTKESLLCLMVGSNFPAEREKAFALCDKFEEFARELKEEIQALLGDWGVLLMPTMPTVAYKHNVSLMKTTDIRFSSMFNMLELPVTHATIRLDEAHGLPFGLSLGARPFNDHLTLAAAEEIELAFGGWTLPQSRGEVSPAKVGGEQTKCSRTQNGDVSTKAPQENHHQQQQQQKQAAALVS